MVGILLWIVLVSAVLATALAALRSSGTGCLWRVDTLELRRQQRFERVLSLHVDAAGMPLREGASLMRPAGTSVGVALGPVELPRGPVGPCRIPSSSARGAAPCLRLTSLADDRLQL